MTLVGTALFIALLLLGVAMTCALWRLIIGPRAQDRVLALDTLYVNAMLVLIVFGMRQGSSAYFEVALLIAALGFASTAALAKFLMRGEVIE
jgi:multicomponent K+:H+ antiporter subunit F